MNSGMIGRFAVLFLLAALTGSPVPASGETTNDPLAPQSDAESRDTGSEQAGSEGDTFQKVLDSLDEFEAQRRGRENFKVFPKKFEAFLQKEYLKVQTIFDSPEGKAYLAQEIGRSDQPSGSAEDAEDGPSSLPEETDRLSPGLDDLHIIDGTEPQARTRQIDLGDGEEFRSQVKDFDEVKRFVIGQLYRDSEALELNVKGTSIPQRGLLPLLIYPGLTKSKDSLPYKIVGDVSDIMRQEGLKEAMGPFIAAYGKAEGDQQKRAQVLLDAYISFKRQSSKDKNRIAAIASALTSVKFLTTQYVDGKLDCGAVGNQACQVEVGALWGLQYRQLKKISGDNKDPKAAANVYAWLADALVVLDLKGSQKAEEASSEEDPERQESSNQALSPGGMDEEDFSARLKNLDEYISKTRTRQRELGRLLLAYDRSVDESEKERMRKRILYLYAGNRTVKPLEVMLDEIGQSPNVRRLAQGPPEGSSEVLQGKFKRVFDRETGSIPVLFQTQRAIRERLRSAGFEQLLTNARQQVAQGRRRRSQGGGQNGPGNAVSTDSTGSGRQKGGVFENLGNAVGPLTEQVFGAQRQNRQLEEQERGAENQRLLEESELERRRRLDAERQFATEQGAGTRDSIANQVDSAQSLLDSEREKERLADEAFDRERQEFAERQRQEQEQRRKSEQEQQAREQQARQSQTQNNAGGQTGPGAPGTSDLTGASGNTGASGAQGTPNANDLTLTDAQILEVAKTKVPRQANSYGIDPAVLTDDQIRAVLDPLIGARVAQYNADLAKDRPGMTVNADLQYSGPGITSTGLPSNHDRHRLWMDRFPELKASAVQKAQEQFNLLLREQVQILSAARQQQVAQRQQQEQQQQRTNQNKPEPVAVAGAPPPIVPVNAPRAPTSSSEDSSREQEPREAPEVASARKVIEEFDEKADGRSGITPSIFLNALSVNNATSPNKLDISLKSLVTLVRAGRIRSRVDPPDLAVDLGPDGELAQQVIQQFEEQAGGKSGITPSEFLRARARLNSTNPSKVEINLPGLIRLINIGLLTSDVAVPSSTKARPDSFEDDGRFGRNN